MKNAILFREYVWLVNTIARADRISLVEINEQWVKTEISGGLPFALSKLFGWQRKAS